VSAGLAYIALAGSDDVGGVWELGWKREDGEAHDGEREMDGFVLEHKEGLVF
jgi:hypothetical protein